MPSFLMVFLFITLHVSSEILKRLNNGHGLLVTVIGLLAVFVGLVILWLVTANLQRILKLFERLTSQRTVATSDLRNHGGYRCCSLPGARRGRTIGTHIKAYRTGNVSLGGSFKTFHHAATLK
jgi:hypothetical protein